MERDTEGFLYPAVNITKCVDCGLCENVCPVLYHQLNEVQVRRAPIVYAAWHLNSSIRMQSSSGGIFTAIASTVLGEGGLVFGAALDNSLEVKHIKVTCEQGLSALRGSKYVQSEIGSTYRQAEVLLRKGKKVLYSGTPCQISGLYTYLGEDYDNLVTCDLICHGVPSPLVFREYITYLEKKFKSQVCLISFRNKPKGWKKFHVTVRFQNGRVYSRPAYFDPFMLGFIRDLYLRPSCYYCHFKWNYKRADITLGDFWGISSRREDLDDNKGTSLVLVNTDKGQDVFDRCRQVLLIEECELEDAIGGNPYLLRSVSLPTERTEFFEKFTTMSFENVIKEYMRPPSLLDRAVSRAKHCFRLLSNKIGLE